MENEKMNRNQLIKVDLPLIKNLLEKQGRLSMAHDIETAIETIDEQYVDTEESLSKIMDALHANKNCSQEELFECCAKAFEIAEKSLLRSRSK
jgi:hypothetical protein